MRVGVVVPWFGRGIPGGAEAVIRELALRLRAAGALVEVLTTTIRDFHADWAVNHHAPGIDNSDHLPIRRFPVARRDTRRFDRLNYRLMYKVKGAVGRSPLSPAAEHSYVNEQMRCPALIDHLRRVRACYDVFVFMPYMFTTTVRGLEAVGERGVLIPALHDESYAYMNVYREMASRAGLIVAQTSAEERLIGRIWGPAAARRTKLLGMGIDQDWHADAGRFRARFGIDGPFLLYAGRRDATKGLYRLLWNYLEYRRCGGRSALVLIGPGELPDQVAGCAGIIDLGFVDRQSKYDAHAAASVLVQPSEREAFSIVVLESWLAGRPVVVEGRSAVNRDHCLLGGGGLYYHTTAEFVAATQWVEAHEDRVRRMVAGARDYVTRTYSWPLVVDRFLNEFRRMAGKQAA